VKRLIPLALALLALAGPWPVGPLVGLARPEDKSGGRESHELSRQQPRPKRDTAGGG